MKKLQIVLPLLLLTVMCFAQQKRITGRVVNQSTKEPLQGVTVQGKNIHALTDSLGRFSIMAQPGETLNLSYVGMNALTAKVPDNTTSLDLVMIEGNADLNQVIVTGYKSERKVDLTGAVAVVNLANVKNVPTSSPMLALQGQVPGLYIQTDGSPTGGNGGPPAILIRGVGTLRQYQPSLYY